MLEKFIANLKQSLPEPIRKKLGSGAVSDSKEDNSDEENKKSHDTVDNDSDAAEKKKKQTSMIIRVVVILGLVYLGVDHLINSDKNAPETVAVAPKPKKNRKKMPAPIAPTNKDLAPEVSKTAAEVKSPSTPEVKVAEEKPAEKVEETQAPIENINIVDKKIEETPAPAPKIEEKVAEEKPSEATPQMGEVKSNEPHLDKSLDSLIDSVDGKDKSASAEAPKKKTMEETIVADDVYTAPPAYDQLGRGLVYNCKEKYWACVDKFAYVNCNKNMKWNKSHQKSAECAVQNVYNSEEDCGVVQKYNVSTSKATGFCQ